MRYNHSHDDLPLGLGSRSTREHDHPRRCDDSSEWENDDDSLSRNDQSSGISSDSAHDYNDFVSRKIEERLNSMHISSDDT